MSSFKESATNTGLGCGVVLLQIFVWGLIIISALAVIVGLFGQGS